MKQSLAELIKWMIENNALNVLDCPNGEIVFTVNSDKFALRDLDEYMDIRVVSIPYRHRKFDIDKIVKNVSEKGITVGYTNFTSEHVSPKRFEENYNYKLFSLTTLWSNCWWDA